MAGEVRRGVMLNSQFASIVAATVCRALVYGVVASTASCAQPSQYEWTRIVDEAPFPKSYNYPVHVAKDGRFVLLLREGNWESRDGAAWARSSLPALQLNSAYQAYVNHAGATYALGALNGNFTRFSIEPTILKTDDHRSWTSLGASKTLPQVVFYASASFAGALWIIGGYDGSKESGEIWRSVDGVEWERMAASAPFGPRMGSKAIVFQNRLYLIGGGALDGPSRNDVWSSADGVAWRRESGSIADKAPTGFTPVVFDGKLWLVGANRSGGFASAMLVSEDGRKFDAVEAPWSPRGGAAAWTQGDRLFVTGGKYSTGAGADIRFIYSNDVWTMRRR